MKALWVIVAAAALEASVASAAPALSEVTVYDDLCEASAAASLGDGYFAIGSDETNEIRIYRRKSPKPMGVVAVTDHDKSDLEDAAVIGDQVYWISSHSLTNKNKDKEERKVFFATSIVAGVGGPTLQPVGTIYRELRAHLAVALGIANEKAIDIEGLAPAPDGGLLIGLREPMTDGALAYLITLTNPAAVVNGGRVPIFSAPHQLALDGLAVRGLTRMGERYLIVAGPSQDAETGTPSRLFWWSGDSQDVTPVDISLEGLNPEAAIPLDVSTIMLVSDDGKRRLADGSLDECKDDEKPIEQRHFRSVDVKVE